MIIFDENPCLFMKRILCEAIVTYSVTNRQGRNTVIILKFQPATLKLYVLVTAHD